MKVKHGFVIREVKEIDNKLIEDVLCKVMKEFNVPEQGTALADPELKMECRLQCLIQLRSELQSNGEGAENFEHGENCMYKSLLVDQSATTLEKKTPIDKNSRVCFMHLTGAG